MPIKSGIGFGEAQVYNTSGITNLYGKLLQQQAKEQAQFSTDLNNIMSKYSTKGLRAEDIKLTAQAYKQIKDKVTSSSIRNPVERAQALVDARNGIQTIQEYSDTALDAYKTLDQLSPDIQLNPWKYKEGTKEAIEALYKNPYANWGDDYKILNQTTFQRQPDDSAIYKMFNNVNSDLAKIAPKFKATDIADGKRIKTLYTVPDADAYSNLYTTMELTPEAKYTLTSKFQKDNPDKTDFTPADVAAYGLDLYKKLYGDDALKFFGGSILVRKETGDDSSNPANYEVIRNKTFSTEEIRDKDKVIKPSKPIITFDTFVTTPVGQPFATPQIGNAFNITEGKSEAIGSKKGLRITGMGVKNGNLRVTVVDDDEFEYYLKPEDIPLTIRNGNQYKAAKKALGSSSAPTPAPVVNNFDVDAYLKAKKLKK